MPKVDPREGSQVERLPGGAALAQLGEAALELVVVEQLELWLPAVDPVDALLVLLELPCFAEAEGSIQDRHRFLG